MPGGVPGNGSGAARGTTHRAHERRIRAPGRCRSDETDDGEHGHREQCLETEMLHGSTSIRSFIDSKYLKLTSGRHRGRTSVGRIVPRKGYRRRASHRPYGGLVADVELHRALETQFALDRRTGSDHDLRNVVNNIQ